MLLTSTLKADNTDAPVTPEIDTTGATLLIAIGSAVGSGSTQAITDNKNNPWTPLTAHQDGTGAVVQIFYSIPTSVGPGHSVTDTGSAGSVPAVIFAAFSGTKATLSFDQQNGAAGASGTTQATGSVTPGEDNELIVAALCFGYSARTITVSGGLSIPQQNDGSTSMGAAFAYLVQTAKAAIEVTFTANGSMTSHAGAIATFKAAATALGPSAITDSLKVGETSSLLLDPEQATPTDTLKISESLTLRLDPEAAAPAAESIKISESLTLLLNPEVAAPATDSLKSADWAAGSNARLDSLQAALTESVRLADLYVSPGAVYYVATAGGGGNDSNPGSSGSPFLTLGHGVSVLTPGDTLRVRAGTYAESLWATIPSGTSWANPVTVCADDPNNRPILRPPGTDVRVLHFQDSQQYIVIDGLVLDAVNVAYDAVKITYGSDPATVAHHIRIQNSEIKNATGATANGVLVSGAAGNGGHNEFLNLIVHDNGSTTFDHGLYLACHNNLVAGCTIYSNSGAGIQVWNTDDDTLAHDNVIRNNILHHNGVSADNMPAVILSCGAGNAAYNNICYANRFGIQVGWAAINTLVANNTIYGSTSVAYGPIVISDATATGTIVRNNVVYGNGAVYADGGTSTTQDHNLNIPTGTTDPVFVNAGTADFHLQSGSPARNAGATVALITTDFDGVARPQEAQYALGAFEYLAGTLLATPPADSLTITDTATCTLTPEIASATETARTADTVTPSMEATSAATETLHVGDTVAVLLDLAAALTETVLIADLLIASRGIDLGTSLSDAVHVAEALSLALDPEAVALPDDAVRVTDTVTVVAEAAAVLSETIRVADVVVPAGGLAIALDDEAVRVVDPIVLTSDLLASLSDTLRAAETVTLARTLETSLTETGLASDTVTAVRQLAVALDADTIVAADTLAPALSWATGLGPEILYVQDIPTVTRGANLAISLTEGVHVVDTVTPQVLLLRQTVGPDTIMGADGLTAAIDPEWIVLAPETVRLADPVIVAAQLAIALTDAIRVTETSDRTLTPEETTAVETVGVADFVQRSLFTLSLAGGEAARAVDRLTVRMAYYGTHARAPRLIVVHPVTRILAVVAPVRRWVPTVMTRQFAISPEQEEDMSVATVEKDPSAILDYGFDYARWLAATDDADTIIASVWRVAPTGANLDIADPTHPAAFDATSTTVWLTDGIVGERYTVTNTITTANGRVDERSLDVVIVEQ